MPIKLNNIDVYNKTIQYLSPLWTANINVFGDIESTECFYNVISTVSGQFPASDTSNISIPGSYIYSMADILKSAYKGAAVTRSMVRDMNNGQQSYSEISAYLGCMYFAKSIMLLHGFWLSSKIISSPSTAKPEYYAYDIFNQRLYRLGKGAPSHKALWSFFCKILSQNDIQVHSIPLYNFVSNPIEDMHIVSANRNMLQYDYSFWIHEDLYADDCLEEAWIDDYLDNRENGYIDIANDQDYSYKKLLIELISYTNIFLDKIQVSDLDIHKKRLKDNYKALTNWHT